MKRKKKTKQRDAVAELLTAEAEAIPRAEAELTPEERLRVSHSRENVE